MSSWNPGPNYEKLSSISREIMNLKLYIERITEEMERLQQYIKDAPLPERKESTHEQSEYTVNKVELYLPKKMENNFENMNLFCNRLKSDKLKNNITKYIHRILADVKICRGSNRQFGIFSQACTRIWSNAEDLKQYIFRTTEEYQYLQTKIRTASVSFPSGLHIDHIMKDLLTNLSSKDIDKNLNDMMLHSNNLFEPYRSYIKTAIAPILQELASFRQMCEKETGGDGGVSEEETFSVVSTRELEGRFGDKHEIAIRRYGPADGPAVYQEWIDGKFSRTLPEHSALWSTQCNANPYMLRLDSLDAQPPEPEGQAKPLCELSTIITFERNDMLLQIASAYLINWANGFPQSKTSLCPPDNWKRLEWLKNFFMTKFQEHFTVADDCPLLEAEDLYFEYSGYNWPGSQLGLIGKAYIHDGLPPLVTVTCMFDIENDGTMHKLHIHYSGTYKYKLKTVGSFDDSSSASDTNPTPPSTDGY